MPFHRQKMGLIARGTACSREPACASNRLEPHHRSNRGAVAAVRRSERRRVTHSAGRRDQPRPDRALGGAGCGRAEAERVWHSSDGVAIAPARARLFPARRQRRRVSGPLRRAARVDAARAFGLGGRRPRHRAGSTGARGVRRTALASRSGQRAASVRWGAPPVFSLEGCVAQDLLPRIEALDWREAETISVPMFERRRIDRLRRALSLVLRASARVERGAEALAALSGRDTRESR